MNEIKVLFIEDEALLRSLFEDAIKISNHNLKYQFRSEDCEDYFSALKFLEEKPAPDVIVLDLRLPSGEKEPGQETPEREKGFALLKKIKSEPKFQKTPVLVFTNLGDKETEERAKELKADEFLIKAKVLPNQLIEKIIQLKEEVGGRM